MSTRTRSVVAGFLLGLASAHAEVPILLVDGDGDGVAEEQDNCPYTKAGEKVDASGCSQAVGDGDVDGVSDADDDCPYTVEGASVGPRGCAIDTDADGVANGLDRCPQTTKNTRVDALGCALSQVRIATGGVVTASAPSAVIPNPSKNSAVSAALETPPLAKASAPSEGAPPSQIVSSLSDAAEPESTAIAPSAEALAPVAILARNEEPAPVVPQTPELAVAPAAKPINNYADVLGASLAAVAEADAEVATLAAQPAVAPPAELSVAPATKPHSHHADVLGASLAAVAEADAEVATLVAQPAVNPPAELSVAPPAKPHNHHADVLDTSLTAVAEADAEVNALLTAIDRENSIPVGRVAPVVPVIASATTEAKATKLPSTVAQAAPADTIAPVAQQVYFLGRDFELPEIALAQVRIVGRVLAERIQAGQFSGVRLVGYAYTAEGKNALQYAKDRAKLIAVGLAGFGVPKASIRMDAEVLGPANDGKSRRVDILSVP